MNAPSIAGAIRSVGYHFAAIAAIACVGSLLQAAEPFLRPDDIVAFVGGEDMVVASETGHLEVRLTRASPDYRLKFRDLAWEGDTVFQQLRDLNYPSLEQQMDAIGATVVIAQFGQMESLDGTARLPEFVAAYEKLIERLRGAPKRRIALVAPTPPSATSSAAPRFAAVAEYSTAIRGVAERKEVLALITPTGAMLTAEDYRDGIHLNERGQMKLATRLAPLLGAGAVDVPERDVAPLAELVRAKNRLWFHYARPQNWAFLSGDRTIQPSSRDHRDPEIRWFPEEMKQWVPLVAAKEQEIWTLSSRLKNR
jgi:hypothetical protein